MGHVNHNPVTFPTRPEKLDEVLVWAERLMQVLDALENRVEQVEQLAYTTAGATLTIDPERASIFTISLNGNCTINLTSPKTVGILTLILMNDGTARTVTFGTGFSANGNLTGIANKNATVQFVSDGVAFYELCRTQLP